MRASARKGGNLIKIVANYQQAKAARAIKTIGRIRLERDFYDERARYKNKEGAGARAAVSVAAFLKARYFAFLYERRAIPDCFLRANLVKSGKYEKRRGYLICFFMGENGFESVLYVHVVWPPFL